MSDPTPDELVPAIEMALREGEIGAVEWLLRALVLCDPQRAQDVVDLMRLGIDLRAAADKEAGQ